MENIEECWECSKTICLDTDTYARLNNSMVICVRCNEAQYDEEEHDNE